MSALFRRVHLANFAVALLAISTEAGGAPLSIVGVDWTTGANRVSRFAEGNQLSDSWLSSRTVFATDLEVLGSFIYLAEYDGAIQKYSLNGVFDSSFPDLSFRAGVGTHTQHLGADAAGNLYSAFSGASGVARKSFRLSNEGTILTTYSHRDLDFPNGIDAAKSGDVYIANSSFMGAGRRVYRFKGDGAFVASYPLPQPLHISKLEIDEARNRMYISGSNDDSIYAYDISAGNPIFTSKLQALRGIRGISVEPTTGRLFGTFGGDVIEIALDSSGVTTFAKGSTSLMAIGAIAVPEPTSTPIAITFLLAFSWHRPKYIHRTT